MKKHLHSPTAFYFVLLFKNPQKKKIEGGWEKVSIWNKTYCFVTTYSIVFWFLRSLLNFFVMFCMTSFVSILTARFFRTWKRNFMKCTKMYHHKKKPMNCKSNEKFVNKRIVCMNENFEHYFLFVPKSSTHHGKWLLARHTLLLLRLVKTIIRFQKIKTCSIFHL